MFITSIGIYELVGLILLTVGASALVSYVCYISAYVTHKNNKIKAEQKAKLAGEEYPEYEVALASTWYSGYRLAAIIILILGACAGIIGICLAELKVDMTLPIACIVGPVVSCVAALAVDYYIVHPIADDKFFTDIETPAIKNFLEPAVEEVVEKVTQNTESTTSNQDLNALIGTVRDLAESVAAMLKKL